MHQVSTSIVGKSESYTVTKVTEHFWAYSVSYQLLAIAGADSSKQIILQKRTGSVELKTTAERTPRPAYVMREVRACVRVCVCMCALMFMN